MNSPLRPEVSGRRYHATLTQSLVLCLYPSLLSLQLMMESMAHVRRNVNRELAGGGGDEKGQVMFTRVLHGARSADIFFDVFFDKGEKKLTYHLLQ